MDLKTNMVGNKKWSHLNVTKPGPCQEKVSKRNEKLFVSSVKNHARKTFEISLWCQARLMHLILLFHPMSRLRYSYFLFWLCEKNEQKEQPKQTWLDNRRPQQRFWTLQQVSRRWQTTIGEDLRRKLWSKEIEWNERKSVRSTRKRTSNDIGNGNSGQTKWSTSPLCSSKLGRLERARREPSPKSENIWRKILNREKRNFKPGMLLTLSKSGTVICELLFWMFESLRLWNYLLSSCTKN